MIDTGICQRGQVWESKIPEISVFLKVCLALYEEDPAFGTVIVADDEPAGLRASFVRLYTPPSSVTSMAKTNTES